MTKDKTAVPTGMALTHLDPIFRERPNEYLDVMRSREPVHQDRMFDRVVLTRAADVEAVMNNRNLASDPRRSRPGSFSRLQLRIDETFRPLILQMDDPDHKRIRDLVVKAFNRPRSMPCVRASLKSHAACWTKSMIHPASTL